MRCLVLMLGVLLCHDVAAAKFRVADFNVPCDSIPDREITVGSKQMPWKNALAFRTELFGENVTVVYLCKDGVLFTENYFFPEREAPESFLDFRKVYDAITLQYGKAWLDNTPWQPNADPRWIEDTPKRYYVTWKNPELRITIALMPREVDTSTKRYLFMIVGAGER